jgi:hypothetical protein
MHDHLYFYDVPRIRGTQIRLLDDDTGNRDILLARKMFNRLICFMMRMNDGNPYCTNDAQKNTARDSKKKR